MLLEQQYGHTSLTVSMQVVKYLTSVIIYLNIKEFLIMLFLKKKCNMK